MLESHYGKPVLFLLIRRPFWGLGIHQFLNSFTNVLLLRCAVIDQSITLLRSGLSLRQDLSYSACGLVINERNVHII